MTFFNYAIGVTIFFFVVRVSFVSATIQIASSQQNLQTAVFDPNTENLFFGDNLGFITRVITETQEPTWNGTFFTGVNNLTLSTFANGNLYFLSENGTFLEINPNNLSISRVLNLQNNPVCLKSKGSLAFIGVSSGIFITLDLNNFQILHQQKLPPNLPVLSCVMPRDSDLLFVGSVNNVLLYNTSNWELVQSFFAYGILDIAVISNTIACFLSSYPNIPYTPYNVATIDLQTFQFTYTVQPGQGGDTITLGAISADGQILMLATNVFQVLQQSTSTTLASVYTVQNVTSVAVQPSNPNIIYSGTQSGYLTKLQIVSTTSFPYVVTIDALSSGTESAFFQAGGSVMCFFNNVLIIIDLESFQYLCYSNSAAIPGGIIAGLTISGDSQQVFWFTTVVPGKPVVIYTLKTTFVPRSMVPPPCVGFTTELISLPANVTILNMLSNVDGSFLVGFATIGTAHSYFKINTTSQSLDYNVIIPQKISRTFLSPAADYFYYTTATSLYQISVVDRSSRFINITSILIMDSTGTFIYFVGEFGKLRQLSTSTFLIQPWSFSCPGNINNSVFYVDAIHDIVFVFCFFEQPSVIHAISAKNVNDAYVISYTHDSFNNFFYLNNLFYWSDENEIRIFNLSFNQLDIYHTEAVIGYSSNETNSIYTFYGGVIRNSVCEAGLVSSGYSCYPCPAGHAPSMVGSHNCNPCPSNQIAPYGSSQCSYCQAGYIPEQIYHENCNACPPGTFATQYNVTCFACSAGQFANKSASTSCDVCDMGYFCNTTGCSECTACEAGYFANATESLSCNFCPSGFFSNSSAASFCLPCLPGSVASKNASAQCDECPPGMYANASMMTECLPCDEGTYVNTFGSTQCQPCPSETICSIAAVYPIPSFFQTQEFNIQNILGKPLPDHSGIPSSIIISTIVFVVILVVLMILWKSLRSRVTLIDKIVQQLDLFYQLSHAVQMNNPVVRRKTKLGGWMTITIFMVMIVASIYMITNFVNYNVIRTTSYFPKPYPYTLSAPEFSAKIQLIGIPYTNCDAIMTSDLIKGNITVNVSKPNEYTCEVSCDLSNCILNGNEQSITLQFNNDLYAPVIGWSIYANYLFDNTLLTNMSGTIVSSPGNVFKGHIPTQFTFDIIPVTFRYNNAPIPNNYGFTSAFQSKILGSQVNKTTFYSANSFFVQLNFKRDAAMIEVNDVQISSIVSLVSTLSALLITTILGTSKTILPYFEKYYYFHKEKKQNRSVLYSLVASQELDSGSLQKEEN